MNKIEWCIHHGISEDELTIIEHVLTTVKGKTTNIFPYQWNKWIELENHANKTSKNR